MDISSVLRNAVGYQDDSFETIIQKIQDLFHIFRSLKHRVAVSCLLQQFEYDIGFTNRLLYFPGEVDC